MRAVLWKLRNGAGGNLRGSRLDLGSEGEDRNNAGERKWGKREETKANREFNRLQLLGKQVKNSVLRILRLLLLRRMK